MALLCLYTNCFAQNIKPLSIGDTVPDITLNHLINYKTPTARLSDFKGRLLVLDFWATWCTACINTFPHNYELQQHYGDKIQILNVGFQPENKIKPFLADLEKRKGRQYHITTVTDDTILKQLFPHTFIPHLVWIDTNRIVRAITAADKLSLRNINKILDGKTADFQQKKDMSLNKPSFLPPVILDSPFNMEHYSILVKGSIYDGAGVGQYYFTQGKNTYGCNYTNYSLENICYLLGNKIWHDKNEDNFFNRKRYIIKIKDTGLLQQFKNDIWQYSFFIPQNRADSFFFKALAEIDRYTGYIVQQEKRTMTCLVLAKDGGPAKFATRGGKAKDNLFQLDSCRISNLPISIFIHEIDDATGITNLPVIDETGYHGNVDIALHKPYTVISIAGQLHSYGLTLIPAQRAIEILTVKVKDQ